MHNQEQQDEQCYLGWLYSAGVDLLNNVFRNKEAGYEPLASDEQNIENLQIVDYNKARMIEKYRNAAFHFQAYNYMYYASRLYLKAAVIARNEGYEQWYKDSLCGFNSCLLKSMQQLTIPAARDKFPYGQDISLGMLLNGLFAVNRDFLRNSSMSSDQTIVERTLQDQIDACILMFDTGHGDRVTELHMKYISDYFPKKIEKHSILNTHYSWLKTLYAGEEIVDEPPRLAVSCSIM